MATNPKFPERYPPKREESAQPVRYRARFPWPIVAVIITICVLAFIAYLIWR